MKLSRRAFVRSIGAGTAGTLSIAIIGSRGSEAAAGSGLDPHALVQGAGRNPIRLDSNENPAGPCPAALDAVRAAFVEASRYPDNPADLTAALASLHGVTPANLVLGCGSGEILRAAVLAFASPTKPIVAPSPTFENPVRDAKAFGWPVHEVPVRDDLSTDLDAMAARSQGAGLVFLCNPNNPTGTVHGSGPIADFVSRVVKASPDTIILVDEAYHEYVEDKAYATAIPLALEMRQVVVSRTFSKAYGMAGLRVGYGIGQPKTIEALRRYRLPNNVNVLGAAAAIAALGQKDHMARERERNREAREFTIRAFADAGFRCNQTHTNFVMADVRREARQFQEACRERGVLVGRPFPPLTTYARISIGTMDEMRAACEVFRKVLSA
jgi:histidinol-phosphate aminotransferase